MPVTGRREGVRDSKIQRVEGGEIEREPEKLFIKRSRLKLLLPL
jgi:hypothetical protein